MKFAALIAAALFATSNPDPAQSMTAAEFLGKAEALIRSGKAGFDTPERRALLDAGLAAANAIRAQQREELETGRPTTLCMPEKVGLDAAEFIGHLTGISRERREVPLAKAFADFMRAKYPCAPANK